MKKAIVLVTNDLVTDQRVHKACMALMKSGFKPELWGRLRPCSPEIDERPYAVKRYKLWFDKGPLFYAEINLLFFFRLLFAGFHLVVANDLDTLLPAFLVCRAKRKPLVFDSHEYFTGTPELVGRPLVRAIWKSIEKAVVPRLPEMITVNDSIAGLFRQEYQVPVRVVRNMPMRYVEDAAAGRAALGLPEHTPILVLQGAGINIQRGAEEMVLAMKYLPGMLLLIIGGGDVLSALKELANENRLNERIMFLPRMPYRQMMQYTRAANLGLTLDKDTNINYRFSLPNKLFDYIQAGIPVLASKLPEVERIVTQYQLGMCITSHQPEEIAVAVNEIFGDLTRYDEWKVNAAKAASELCWENEEPLLIACYEQFS
ncbi:MAG TPA: glycosyltransferase [Bacteroidales bacterium]|nr:glycosyltransferase [Bacteroidales bacterium]